MTTQRYQISFSDADNVSPWGGLALWADFLQSIGFRDQMQSWSLPHPNLTRGGCQTEAKDDASRKNIEIDFLIRQMKKICPIEVKSGDYRKHASLDFFVNKYRDRLGKRYIICTKDLKVEGDLVLLPVYMTGCL